MSEAAFEYDAAAIGHEVEVARLAITRELIARYCEMLGETHPLWTDDTAAARGTHRGIIAPPMFLAALPSPSVLSHGVRFGNSTFVGGRRLELGEPVRPGDEIVVREQLLEPYAKTGRTGTMVFAVRRITYLNQHGAVAGVADVSTVYRQTEAVTGAGTGTGARETSLPASPLGHTAVGQAFPDIDVGNECEREWVAMPEQVAAYMAFMDLVAPGPSRRGTQNYFMDEATAMSTGLQRPIAQGGLVTAVAVQLVTNWLGEAGAVRSIDASFRRSVLHGDRLRIQALVTDVHEGQVKIDLALENERGERPIQAVVAVALADRETSVAR